MAKAAKKSSPDARADGAQRSVLAAAWAAVESGDVTTARALARSVIGGTKGPDDDAVAKALAKQLTAPDQDVGELPEQVAQAIVDRTTVPPRTYAYGAICLAVFLTLAALARARYGGA
ncbi:MAG: hypothetical protein INH41_09225 [Myxococcaceae bacterium]|jgi:hypothetical protein|nr:hypothetical protein [Myxococcaceae bacterium]